MSVEEEKLDPVKFHEQHAGKITINSKVDVSSEEDLSVVYTPGVSQVCTAIANDETKANTLTSRGNMIGVITDGTAVLGLGDIGPKAAIPVMEGKSILFKQLAGVDAFLFRWILKTLKKLSQLSKHCSLILQESI